MKFFIRMKWRYQHYFKGKYWNELLFKQYIYDHLPEEIDYNKKVVLDTERHMNGYVEEHWSQVRAWMTKGLSGGLISSLTLVGSQIWSGDGDIKRSVFWLTMCFLIGLGFLLLRHLMFVLESIEARNGQVAREYDPELGYIPRNLYFVVAWWMDRFALFALVIGISFGVYVLNSLT